MKKVGKTTRPLRYDLNQTPYDYTVEVTNRFKGLDLIDKVPDRLWMEIRDTVQKAVIKTIPKRKKCKKTKWLSEETSQIAEKRRKAKCKGENKRYMYLNAEFQRTARRDKEAFLSDQCKEIEENNRIDLFRKIRNKSPVQVRCVIQGSQDWCTEMTQRDGMGMEVRRGFRMGKTCTPVVDSCQLMANPIQYCKLISLQLK